MSKIFTDILNQYHQWTFNDQIPREKITYDLAMNKTASILIIPDFDFEVDSGKYQCSTTNTYGTTTKIVHIDENFLRQL